MRLCRDPEHLQGAGGWGGCRVDRFYGFLASKGFAVFNLLFLTINLILVRLFNIKNLIFVSVALALLFVNLLACFIRNRGFKRWTMTLFHLLLLLFIASSAYGSLFFFYGYLELAEGQFEKMGYQDYVKGPLHKNTLDEIAIYQDKIMASYKDDYNTDLKSFIRVYKKRGGGFEDDEIGAVVSPLDPFMWRGYSFYLHRDRGYSAAFLYEKDGRKKNGFVDFPNYISFPERQKNGFTIPGEGLSFWAELKINDSVERKGVWGLRYPRDISLNIERGGENYSLKPGAKATLKNGASLEFLGISLWTNYVIYYNPVGKIMGLLGLGAFIALLIHYMPGFVRTLIDTQNSRQT